MKHFSIEGNLELSKQGSTLPLTESNLKRLNQKVVKQSTRLYYVLEKQVNNYLSTLEPNIKEQLSKNQILRSREKTYLWHRSNKQYINKKMVVPEEYLKKDKDPTQYNSKKKRQSPNRYTKGTLFNVILTGQDFEENRLPKSPTIANTENHNQPRVLTMAKWLASRKTLVYILPEAKKKILQVPEEERESLCTRFAIIHSVDVDLLKKYLYSKEEVCPVD